MGDNIILVGKVASHVNKWKYEKKSHVARLDGISDFIKGQIYIDMMIIWLLQTQRVP